MDGRTRRLWNRLANAAIVGALALAAAPAGMRAYGHWSQSAARAHFTAPPPPAASTRARPADSRLVKSPPARAWETSVLEIPSIGVNAVVDEGNEDWQLMPGPGHEPRSAGAGGRGNCIIAAHRNMWEATFADLPTVKPGNPVTLTTSRGIFTYRVVSSRETSTRDRSALGPTSRPMLTLYTCVVPFHPSRRWVVRARLTDAWVQGSR